MNCNQSLQSAPGIVQPKRLLPDRSDEYVMYSKRDLETVIEIVGAFTTLRRTVLRNTRPLLAEHMERMNEGLTR